MNIALLEREMETKIKQLFKADAYHFELVEILVTEKQGHDEIFVLEQDANYYLASEKLDIPTTVALYLSSECNFLATSKEDWEFENNLRLETFRNYLNVRTENATIPFEFKLKFLKVTPYRK